MELKIAPLFAENIERLQIDGIFILCDRDIAQLGLARLSGGQKVASSNLAIPTIFFVLYNPVLYGWIFLYLDFTQRTTGIYSKSLPQQRTNRERQILSKSVCFE